MAILFLFVVFVGGGWMVGKLFGSIFFNRTNNGHTPRRYIDRSNNIVHHHHHHYHDNRSVNINGEEFKNVQK